jgi:2-oxoglutarate ferredoxin oxidoreductase subunit alpha
MKLNGLPRTRTGTHFQTGNWAVAEGALAAGLTNYYGYPITPSTEIAEFLARRLPDVGGSFWQMEDEIASITACIGSSWAGGRTMTATSGPGFSLMMEGLGLATMTDTPLVLVNSMRVGPSTGMPTAPGQGDFMQSRFGSHGDFIVPVLAPSTVQECFDLTLQAFSLSEIVRTPVILLLDQVLSSIHESVTIPTEKEISQIVYDRKMAQGKLPGDLVLPMRSFGSGAHVFGTGLTHKENGMPDLTESTHQTMIQRMFQKLEVASDWLPFAQLILCEDADTVVVAYGSQARPAHEAVLRAREQGISAGLMKLLTCWPFPQRTFKQLSKQAKTIIVPELSMGQLIWPVERFADRNASIIHLPKIGGNVVSATEILLALGGSIA